MNEHVERDMSIQPRKTSQVTEQVTALHQQDKGDRLQKLVIGTPPQHGQACFFPESDQWSNLWQQACQSSNHPSIADPVLHRSDSPSLAVHRLAAREELCRLAIAHTSRYQSCDILPDASRIIISGHQPELFHPGVWFKNFVLSALGQSCTATAINLIVDNDLCADCSIQVPDVDLNENGELTVKQVAVDFDQTIAAMPFEERRIRNQSRFDSFSQRVTDIVTKLAPEPLIKQLWPQVQQAQIVLTDVNGDCNLGQAIAAGRHRLEKACGLQTLEVPLSQIVDTDSFARFSLQILMDADRFLQLHNGTVQEYRQLYRLRSRSHPIPELERQGDWCETPFWIWNASSQSHPMDQPILRRPLYVRQTSKLNDNRIEIELGDGDQWSQRLISQSDLESTIEQFLMLKHQGIKIRPRAIVTTMYCRCILSDLFLHGVGGGKYDQVTDLIARRFWDVVIPPFAVASFSFKWLSGLLESTHSMASVEPRLWHALVESSQIREDELAQLREQLRNVEQHPDRVMRQRDPQLSQAPPGVKAIIERKQAIVAGHIPLENGREKYLAIAQCNQKLLPYVAAEKQRLQERMERLSRRLELRQSIDSRDISICLYPESILETIKAVLTKSM